MMRILFIFCIIQVGEFQYSLNTYVSVTVSVLNHHHSACVYLLHSTHQQGQYRSASRIDVTELHVSISTLVNDIKKITQLEQRIYRRQFQLERP